MPFDSAGARAASSAEDRLARKDPAASSAAAPRAAALATAAAALEACGPHTHGAVRLLQRERLGLLAAALNDQ